MWAGSKSLQPLPRHLLRMTRSHKLENGLIDTWHREGTAGSVFFFKVEGKEVSGVGGVRQKIGCRKGLRGKI